MFLKKLLLLPLVLAFASNAALAANSVDLRVTGTITPSACDISVAGGAFDLGSISVGDLAKTTTSELPAVGGQTLNIACSGATQVAFKAIDNRSDSLPADSTSDEAFGLGVDSANNPIGSYKLDIEYGSVITDGGASLAMRSYDGGASWFMDFSGADYHILNAPSFLMTLNEGYQNGTPRPLTNSSAVLKVTPTIQPTNTLDTSTDISIDGSATIELVYL